MKKLILLALVLGSSICSFAQNVNSAQLLKRYRYSATEAFKANNFGLALDYAKKVDSLQPNQQDIKFIIGVSYLHSSTKTLALDPLLFAKSKKYKPRELDFHLAKAFHYSNQFDSAIKYLNSQLTKIDTTATGSFDDLELFENIKLKKDQCVFGKQMVHDSLNVEIVNLGPGINTKYSEYVPIVTADEKLMYFTSRRHTHLNRHLDIDTKPFENIYVSTFENNKWQAPKELGAPLNGGDHDACIGISPDGQKLFVYRSKSARATAGSIYSTYLDGENWTKLKKLGSNVNSRRGWESSVCLTPNGKRLYFSSDREGGLGGHDIYYSELGSDGEWGPAVNVGAPINTADNEDAPFMHFDGTTMFYSSDGHKTIGGYDIFSSSYLADSSKWSNPINLGYPINTADDDVYFVYSADGSKGYFSSHRKEGMGEKDIYYVKRPNADPNMIVMAGHILDHETNQPIYATITVTNLETKNVIGVFNTNKLTGRYVLALNFDVNHSIEIEADGYVFNSENVNISKKIFKLQHNQDFTLDKVKKVETPTSTTDVAPSIQNFGSNSSQNFTLEKVKAGAKVTLNNIFFEFDKYTLKTESTVELDNLYEMLLNNPSWSIEISGHTDSIGTDEYNLWLSKARSLTVVNYLIEKGINPKSLVAVGYGESKPVATNSTEEGRTQNRRTDMTIKEIDHSEVHGKKFHKLKLDDVLEKTTEEMYAGYKLKMKVHFMMNDGEILTEYSHKQLDHVVEVLKHNHKYKVKLLGYVDCVKGEYNNEKLYNLRIRTVLNYLIENGISHSRILSQEFVPYTTPKVDDLSKADIKKRKVEFLLTE